MNSKYILIYSSINFNDINLLHFIYASQYFSIISGFNTFTYSPYTFTILCIIGHKYDLQ